ncbi:MAG: HD domain-containing protein [Mogibacterium sp.]|nr:HD domain-containing protein [Mogibacterium sp.]
MLINITGFLNVVSLASDYVEADLLSIEQNHVKRVAIIVNRLAAAAGMDEDTVYAMTQAGVLHDCALAEYIHDELSDETAEPLLVVSAECIDGHREVNMADHCIAGERMVSKLPFYDIIRGAVLHHHDRANGSGALGKTAAETPLCGQLMHIADRVDAAFDLSRMDRQKHADIVTWLRSQSDIMFSEECCRLFIDNVDYELLCSAAEPHCVATLDELLPDRIVDIPTAAIRELSTIFADITDYKSRFTSRHSIGIAEKAARMGAYYGYSAEMRDKLYIAGALHDIGKLLISNDILEKPGRLTDDEYQEITNHAIGTWMLLKDIEGLDEICRWASLHHEKLDGSGYPFGYSSKDLGKEERLLACLDIYQALTEDRPYKNAMPHDNAVALMRGMGKRGKLDEDIIDDIADCFAIAEQS